MPQHHQVTIKGAPITDDTQLKEHGEGFASREKIARTPPEEKRAQQKRGAQHQMENMSQHYGEDGSLSQSPSRRQLPHSQSDGAAALNQPPLPLHQQYIYYQQ